MFQQCWYRFAGTAGRPDYFDTMRGARIAHELNESVESLAQHSMSLPNLFRTLDDA